MTLCEVWLQGVGVALKVGLYTSGVFRISERHKRFANVAGVAWGCHWDYEENGVWKEVCYCEDKDGCNASSQLRYGVTLVVMTTLSLLFGHL